VRIIKGVGVSAGRTVGPVVRMPDPIPEPSSGGAVPEAERESEAARIAAAAETVKADLQERAAAAAGEGKALLEATALMASDPTLVAAATGKVTRDGLVPERAVWEAAGEVATMLSSLGGYLAERARDVHDVRDRLCAALTGRPAPGVPSRSEPFVLTALDLAPADTATLDPATCLALVTGQGGPTSHTAILAKALGLPAVVAAPEILEVDEGTVVLVDGSAGTVGIEPDADTVAKVRAIASVQLAFDGTGTTGDGHRVQLLANVGDPKGVQAAVDVRAEGVGLFRTEFCFLDRPEAPSVDDQVAMYRQVLAAFPGKKVVVRTLDAGADKPLPFLTDTEEENPALGVRGYRTSARSPQVLADQLAAIAQAAAAEDADVWVMAPMVSTVDEARTFVAACAEHGLPMAGVMIETPAAAVTADHILEHAMFASLGTNDLGQYTMAADRLLGELATLNDPWQPAVLRMVKASCEAGRLRDRPVGVCGEAASDPALAVVLVGLGVSSLSMTPRSIPAVAAVLARTSLQECRRLAAVAVDAPTAEAARAAVRASLGVLDELGL
jgi:phosphoenolpyruvate-protein phosphotransferase (PTS system enzyme I)